MIKKRILAHVKFGDEIGRGSFGKVVKVVQYPGRDPETLVAKIIFGTDESTKDATAMEARTLKAVGDWVESGLVYDYTWDAQKSQWVPDPEPKYCIIMVKHPGMELSQTSQMSLYWNRRKTHPEHLQAFLNMVKAAYCERVTDIANDHLVISRDLHSANFVVEFSSDQHGNIKLKSIHPVDWGLTYNIVKPTRSKTVFEYCMRVARGFTYDHTKDTLD